MIRVLITKKHVTNISGKAIYARVIKTRKGRILEVIETKL
jgi:hypothetical protein